MSYPATEGLQHIRHDQDQYSGLRHDERAAYKRDGIQAYDKQALADYQAPGHYTLVTAQRKEYADRVERYSLLSSW
ncbi:uncharacterized protein RSE6_13306 [Rhynchosporium secalis]|uniref:Uncharacterized protein n=1 Tax=Rhynchosporium secalis TaxID=38038 RepID=A0A1E1MSK6_RHYSE|nr:uncharacterized protein RSE6_13306 [Rhynchosporium secalis]